MLVKCMQVQQWIFKNLINIQLMYYTVGLVQAQSGLAYF